MILPIKAGRVSSSTVVEYSAPRPMACKLASRESWGSWAKAGVKVKTLASKRLKLKNINPIFFTRSGDSIYKLEIGSLPAGVDIAFSKNNRYSYEPVPGETEIDLKIVNEDGSRKGNFSVTVYFTKIGATNSSITCQLNVVNK